MASYTKTYDLIVKNHSGNTIIIKPNLSGDFYFGEGALPYLKTLKKVEINVYCKSGSGQVIYFEFQPAIYLGFVEVEHNIQIGWNKVVIEYGNGWFWEEKYNEPLIDISPDVFTGRDVEIYTQNSNYKPYVIVTYEDTPPKKPTSLYPANTTVNARNKIRFSWVHNSQEKTPQKGFVLEYSVDYGATWITISKTTSYPYYDMPANTLPTTGKVMWRVKTIDTSGAESEFSNAEFNTELVSQKAPTLVSPLTGYLDGSKPIVFRWNFVGGTAEDKQAKYDLQYSLNQGSSWTTITVESNTQEHTILENTFQTGNVYWRVRTYNAYGDVSPYSEIGSFYVINSPPIPQIFEVTNSGRPIICWNSVEQKIYEIEIFQNGTKVFGTGKIPSEIDRSYKLPIFLDDGEYLTKLRVTNEYDLTSPWAEYMFTLETTKPEKPSIELFNGEYSITIKTDETSLKTLVYRDNKLIGEMEAGHFEDYTGENKKEHQYFIRVVDENDNFNNSDVKVGKCKFKGNTLALANNPKEFIKLKLGYQDIAKKSSTVGNTGSLIYFDGRKYPVVEFSEFKEHAKTLSFFIRNKEELNKLIELIDKKETVIYRDADGEVIYGAILNINYEKNLFGYEVNFTITRTGDAYD